MKNILLVILVCWQSVMLSQANAAWVPGTSCNTCTAKAGPLSVANGSALIATSYTASACGLDYAYSNLQLNQRSFSNGLVGLPQPASFTISGIPPCATILKAFLYVGTVGTGTAINASLTNPAGTSSVFPMTLIGSDISVCWNTDGTFSYRSDVTALISGNGNYTVSGIPATATLTSGNDDAEGATLFIIYSNPAQNYTGNIVIADGCLVSANGGYTGSTITGFNVCGTPSLTNNFMILCDMQQINNTDISLNSAVNSPLPDYTKLAATDHVWDFISEPGTAAVAGQSSANYGFVAGSDCVGLMMAGMYYRSGCLVCPSGPSTVTLSVTSTTACLASATVVAGGATGPYTYSWTGTAQSGSVATNLAPGTYTVRATDQGGCGTGSTTVVIKSPTLAVSVISTFSCPSVAVAIVNGGNPNAAYTYSWMGTAQTGAIASNLGTGTYSVYVQQVSSCETGSASVLIVSPAFSIGINNPLAICPGNSVSLATGPAASYTWSPAASLNSVSLQTVIASPLASTIYTVNYRTSLGCTGSHTTAVIISQVQAVDMNNVAVCETQSIAVVPPVSGLGYSWTGPGNYASAQQSLALFNTSPSMSGVYNASVITANCTYTSALTLTVLATPQPTPSGNSPLCANTTLSLTVNNSNSYSWTGPNSFASNLQSPLIINAGMTAAGNYSVSTSFTNGCSRSTTINVQVNPLPVPLISANNPVCEGSTLSLNASDGIIYQWTGPNGFSSNLQSPIIAGVSNNSAGLYTVVATSAASCSAAASQNVFVNFSPTLTPLSYPACEGNNLQLFSNALGATSFSWSGPAAFASSLPNPVINAVQFSNAGIYTLTATALNGCQTQAITSVIIYTVPVLSALGATVCYGVPVNLTANGAAAYSWSGPSNFTASGANVIIPAATALSSGAYTVTGAGLNSCISSTVVYVSALPLPVVTAQGATVCAEQSATLTAGGASAYFWSGPFGYASNTTNAFIPVAVAQSAGNYTVIGIAANSCTNLAVVNLTVLPMPQLTVSPVSSTICTGESVTLAVSGAQTYSWQPQNWANTATVVISPAATSVVIVEGRDREQCKSSATSTISVDPCTGIEAYGIMEAGLQVFPNPSNGNFEISATLHLELEIINGLGQRIRTLELDEKNGYRVFITGLADGVYYLVSTGKDRRFNKKLLVGGR